MIDTNVTKHLAQLSKLSFDEEELNNVTRQMSDIIELMDKVCEFDSNVKTFAADAKNFETLRGDNPEASYPTEDIIKNSGAAKDNCFVVPKVV